MPKRVPSSTQQAVNRRLKQEIDDMRNREGPPGPSGGAGAVGPQGPAGPAGATGADGPAGLSSIGTPTATSRTVNTDFTPSSTMPMLVGYSAQLHTVLTALGTSSAQLQLLSDPGPGTPTTVRSMTKHQIVLGVGLSINSQSDVTSSVYAMVPAGWVVRLVSAGVNGGTVTLMNQVEVPLQP